MALTIGQDIVDSVGRANYCFWLDDPKVDRTLPLALVTLVIIVTTLNLSLLGKSDSVFAGAVYTLYLILSFSIAGVIVFIRNRRVESRTVLALIEAYVVLLFITMLLMMHNIFMPIPFFGINVNVNRGLWMQLVVVYGYALPGAVYLYWNSRNWAAEQAIVPPPADGSTPPSAELIQARLAFTIGELGIWSIVHFAIVGFLIWLFLFANPTKINELAKLLPTIS